MKKTLAIILSIVMLFGMISLTSFAADDASAYDRSKISSGDEAYIDELSAEQMATVILDWLDRQIAEYTDEITQGIADEVLAGFDAFEASFLEEAVYSNIPEIDSLDDVIAYKSYISELGGDFAALDTTKLITREEAGSSLAFISGLLGFMADNADAFGKIFRWDDDVFDYGKVGEYILSLDTTDEDNKKIVDFYNDYLIGNDIQDKLVNMVAEQMGYEVEYEDGSRTETFDAIINNGIVNWFAGVCEDADILSAKAIKELKAYDLRTTDIYTLVKNFVALVESDNEAKIDTYYNYVMDTVVRTLMKSMLGQTAQVGDEADVPESFADIYTDLELLEEISGGTVYYKDGDNYYQIAVADGKATANALTWTQSLDINFEPPTATAYTGADADTLVAEYNPSSTKYLDAETMPVYMYASAVNQATMATALGENALTFDGTEVPDEYAAIIADGEAITLDSRVLFNVKGSANNEAFDIDVFDLDLTAVQAAAKATAKEKAQEMLSTYTVESVDFDLVYTGYVTEDEFIVQVTVENIEATVSGIPFIGTMTVTEDTETFGSIMTSAVESVISNPLITIVADELSGSLGIEDAQDLFNFVDTDFDIDQNLLAFSANYDAYDGVIGQVNHILYGIVDMLVSDEGMAELDLVDGDNNNLTANLEKICATANDMMAAAEEVMNDEGLQDVLNGVGLDIGGLAANLDLDLIYSIDFSSVEGLLVSVINLGLDMIDDGTNEVVAAVHTAVDDLENLDAMAVAVTDYALAECLDTVNAKLGTSFSVAKTDASTVADGQGKDIIMTKIVDLVYDAAAWGVGYLNDTVNDYLAEIFEENAPEIAFEFGVEKGENWEATLTALVDRVYDLADGIIIACDNDYTDTFDRISALANAILPMGSLASNCASDNFAFDTAKVIEYMFDDALDGDLDGLLGLFETKTKTDDVAANVPVTKAIINAAAKMLNAVLPGAIADCEASETLWEDFTSNNNIQTIVADSIDSINTRKATLVPAALNLVREAGLLPYFAKCNKEHVVGVSNMTLIEGTQATCSTQGVEDAYKCSDCGYTIGGGTIATNDNHVNTTDVEAVEATCTSKGYTAGVWCNDCNKYVSGHEEIAMKAHEYGDWYVYTAASCEADGVERHECACGAYENRTIDATGHTDADGDDVCDTCGESLAEENTGFFAKIIAFFQSIINWIKNLFK